MNRRCDDLVVSFEVDMFYEKKRVSYNNNRGLFTEDNLLNINASRIAMKAVSYISYHTVELVIA